MDENKKTEKDSNGKTGFIVLVSFSVLIMIVAVTVLYLHINVYQPDSSREKSPTAVMADNEELVNDQSPQVLEEHVPDVNFVPLGTPLGIIITAGVLMFIIVVSMIVVKVLERKDN